MAKEAEKMGVKYDDIDALETGMSNTFDVYKNIRSILETGWAADGLRSLSEITFDDWNRMCGLYAGVLRLFEVAERLEEQEIDTQLAHIHDLLKADREAEEVKGNEHTSEA